MAMVIQVKPDRELTEEELIRLEELADEWQCEVHVLHVDGEGHQVIPPRRKKRSK